MLVGGGGKWDHLTADAGAVRGPLSARDCGWGRPSKCKGLYGASVRLVSGVSSVETGGSRSSGPDSRKSSSSVFRTLSSSESWASSSDVSGDGWGMFGVHVLRRGGRTSQNRLSDNITPLFFGRPARAGRTLTVMGLIISVRSGRRLGKSRSSSMPSSSARGKRDRLTADAGAWLGAGVVVRAGLCD